MPRARQSPACAMISLAYDVMSACQLVCVTLLVTCLHPAGAEIPVHITFLTDIEIGYQSGYGRYIGGAFPLALEEKRSLLRSRNVSVSRTILDTNGDRTKAMRLQMSMRNQTDVFIGPNGKCELGMVAATALDIPYLTYSCYDRIMLESTGMLFVNTEPVLTNVVQFVLALLRHFDWRSYALICSEDAKWWRACKLMANVTTSNNIRINGDPYDLRTTRDCHPRDDSNAKILKNTKDKTRVYVFMGSGLCLGDFMKRMHSEGMTDTGEYAVVAVIDSTLEEIRQNALFQVTPRTFKNIFRNLLWVTPQAVSNVNWESFLDNVHRYNVAPPFNFPRAPIPELENTRPRIDISAAYVYDAVTVFIDALLESVEKGLNFRDPWTITQQCRNRTFISKLGYESFIDGSGFNRGNYTVWAMEDTDPLNDTVTLVGRIIASSDHSNSDLVFKPAPNKKIFWVSGKNPISDPACGFDGAKCDRTHHLLWASLVLGVLVIIGVAVGCLVRRQYLYNQKLERLMWKISLKEIEFEETVSDKLTARRSRNMVQNRWRHYLGYAELERRNSQSLGVLRTGTYRGTTVVIKHVVNPRMELTRAARKKLQLRKEMNRDNINHFIGACIEQQNIYIVSQFCPRGSLEDILRNDEAPLDDMFIASLLGDLIKGMQYIHDSEIVWHGNLRASNCLVDSRWLLQVADFGLHPLLPPESSLPRDERYYSRLAYRAPELLREGPGGVGGSQKGDVYSFALVLFHVMGRQGPWHSLDMTWEEVVRRVSHPEDKLFRPPLSTLENCPAYFLSCMEKCWAEDPDERLDFRGIRNRLRPMEQGLSPNIFDNLLAIMERYAKNLEDAVTERTEQLSMEKRMTENLLLRMLPRSVAETLKRGQSVKPEQYESVSIYFSDIVGFTQLSAACTPMQVVDLLNDLYTCFDSVIESYDVYKVETIGDAYMVVSGLPIRNGDNHAGEIASMSLHLLAALTNFRVRHDPDTTIRIRIGIHSGPCCAGVVGLKMPRYCLFGDTVNTASRMESTGEALKIHCSKECKAILDKLGGYYLEERGHVTVKGKGPMLTYYLVGEDKEQRARRMGHDPHKSPGDPSGEERSTSNLDTSEQLFCLIGEDGNNSNNRHRDPPLLHLRSNSPTDVSFTFPDSPSTLGLPSPGPENSETLCLLPGSSDTLPHARRARTIMWDDRRTPQPARSCDLSHAHMNGKLPESVV